MGVLLLCGQSVILRIRFGSLLVLTRAAERLLILQCWVFWMMCAMLLLSRILGNFWVFWREDIGSSFSQTHFAHLRIFGFRD